MCDGVEVGVALDRVDVSVIVEAGVAVMVAVGVAAIVEVVVAVTVAVGVSVTVAVGVAVVVAVGVAVCVAVGRIQFIGSRARISVAVWSARASIKSPVATNLLLTGS